MIMKTKKLQTWDNAYHYLNTITDKDGRQLNGNTYRVLAFLVTKGEMFNIEHTEKERNKSNIEDKYHFYCDIQYIADKLSLSRFTVNRSCSTLEEIGIIKKYRSIQTSKWYINYQLLSEIENQTINNPTPHKTEQQMINDELEVSMNDTVELAQACKEVVTEQLETEKLETMNVIMANVENEVLSNNEVEQLDNVINTYNNEIENVNKQTTKGILELSKLKGLMQKYKGIPKELIDFQKAKYDIYYQLGTDKDDYIAKLFVYKQNNPQNSYAGECYIREYMRVIN